MINVVLDYAANTNMMVLQLRNVSWERENKVNVKVWTDVDLKYNIIF